MAEKRYVEVRFDCGLHDMIEEQALGLLRGLDEYDPIVGLAFENMAGVILVTDKPVEGLKEAMRVSTELGLRVACTQTMTPKEYDAAAWGEVGDLDE